MAAAAEEWHTLQLDPQLKAMHKRTALEAWTWVWITVDHAGQHLVHLSLWNGVRFLTANGQTPIYGNVIAYQRLVWPEPFTPGEGESVSTPGKEGTQD